MKEYIVTEHPDFPYEEPKPQELIRCKDCRMYEQTNAKVGTCLLTNAGAFPEGYCFWAERKDND